ncbi:DUF6356 family protein [Pelagibius marinus]|uniref:DUF6356 family protein n=1 Tax=Pelagibius marinus TaxID=2762760 RepID=UPI001872F2EB|nr:DUF6356 family protein [Pelagibius marinus]
MSFRDLFTEHPASVGETYWQHLASAWGFSWRMMLASLACLIHALLPFLFVKTGSRAITGLHDRMVVNRHRQPAQRASDSPAPENASRSTA